MLTCGFAYPSDRSQRPVEINTARLVENMLKFDSRDCSRPAWFRAAHWQAIWRAENPGWRWVEQRDWESPDCSEWVNTLDGVVADCPGPVVIIAHSLGCIAFAHW